MRPTCVSIPLQGLEAFGPQAKNRLPGHALRVSIPLQGLEAFGPLKGLPPWSQSFVFQSPFKDYNLSDAGLTAADEFLVVFQSLFKDYNLSDPQYSP